MDRSYTQYNASSKYLQQTLCVELTFNWFLKMLGEMKRSILNVNLKKYPRQVQHFALTLKWSFLLKLLTTLIYFSKKDPYVSQVLSSPLTTINQKLFTNNKRAISRFFGTVTLLPSRDFTCSKVTTETLKTLEQDVKCVWC